MALRNLNPDNVKGYIMQQINEPLEPTLLDAVFQSDMNSTQFSETYGLVGDYPQLRRWQGSRQINQFADYSIKFDNLLYEATVDIDVDDYNYSKRNLVEQRINSLPDAAQRHWESGFADLLNTGTSRACFDGQFFFSASHSWGSSGTMSNNISTNIANLGVPTNMQGTPTSPSQEVFARAILAGLQQFYTFKSDTGIPLNGGMKSIAVVTGPALMGPASGAINELAVFSNGQTNPLRNTGFNLELIVSPWLTNWTDRFAILRLDGPDGARPLIRTQMGQVVSSFKDDSHDNNRFEYGIKTWRGMTYGLWYHAVMNTLVQV
jgi:phage major head subunit gpT-like protein